MLAELGALLTAFLATPEGQAVKLLLVGSIITFALGAFAALRDRTFDFAYVDSFVRSTMWGRVAPVLTFLLIGYVASEPLVSGPAIVGAGVVAAGMLKAAADSIGQIASPKEESAARNTPPTA